MGWDRSRRDVRGTPVQPPGTMAELGPGGRGRTCPMREDHGRAATSGLGMI